MNTVCAGECSNRQFRSKQDHQREIFLLSSLPTVSYPYLYSSQPPQWDQWCTYIGYSVFQTGLLPKEKARLVYVRNSLQPAFFWGTNGAHKTKVCPVEGDTGSCHTVVTRCSVGNSDEILPVMLTENTLWLPTAARLKWSIHIQLRTLGRACHT